MHTNPAREDVILSWAIHRRNGAINLKKIAQVLHNSTALSAAVYRHAFTITIYIPKDSETK